MARTSEVSSLTVILGFYLMSSLNVNYSPNRSTPEGGYRKVRRKLISGQDSSSAPLSRREKWVLFWITANLSFITWGSWRDVLLDAVDYFCS